MNHSEIFNRFGLIIAKRIPSATHLKRCGPVVGAAVLTEGLPTANITQCCLPSADINRRITNSILFFIVPD